MTSAQEISTLLREASDKLTQAYILAVDTHIITSHVPDVQEVERISVRALELALKLRVTLWQLESVK